MRGGGIKWPYENLKRYVSEYLSKLWKNLLSERLLSKIKQSMPLNIMIFEIKTIKTIKMQFSFKIKQVVFSAYIINIVTSLGISFVITSPPVGSNNTTTKERVWSYFMHSWKQCNRKKIKWYLFQARKRKDKSSTCRDIYIVQEHNVEIQISINIITVLSPIIR